MSLTDRDRKIVMILAPLLLLAVYWFVVLAPQRGESTKVASELTKARGERDTAQAQVGQLNAAKASFASDYQTVIRMGKAVPDRVDMPSLLVQLDRAARGTGVDLDEITVTEPNSEAGASTPPGGGGAGAGGSGAQSMPGKAAEGAGNAVNDANAKSQASAGADPSAPGGAAPATASGAPAGASAPGLSSVGLTFKLRGEFFDMADFFHRMKRFVRVVNDQVVIRGRLISIDRWSFKSDPTGFVADVGATVYLSPKAEGGVSAGASPTGPSGAPGGGNVASDPAASPSPPTASATP